MNTNGEDLIIVNVSGTMPACVCSYQWVVCRLALQWGPADAEVVVPSVETPEADKCSPFKAWSRSEYSHACLVSARHLFLVLNLFVPGPPTFMFPNRLPMFSVALLLANTVFPCWATE